MSLYRILIPVVWAASLAFPLRAETNVTVQMDVPVLTVRESTGMGRCEGIRLTYARGEGCEPLRISISDNEPLGTGDSLRAAVWLAAVTAAVARNDPMSSARISLDCNGFIDGPSAGGVFCLALLTAMDGRQFPVDLAMTGTILPDGTIGLVGGVAQKVRAAAKAGKKRIVIPLFERFEEQDEKIGGGVVDLFRLGRELDVDVHPVADIAEAYSYAHGVKLPDSYVGRDAEILPLPAEIEKALIEEYRAWKRALEAKLNGPTKDLPERLGLLETHGEDFFGSDHNRLFNAGFLAAAVDDIARQVADWRSLGRFESFRQSFLAAHPVCVKTNGFSVVERREYAACVRSLLAESEAQVDKGVDRICECPSDFISDGTNVSTVAVQFRRQIAFSCQAAGLLLSLENRSPDQETVTAAGEFENGEHDERLVGWFRLEMLKRFEAFRWQQRIKEEPILRLPVARKLPLLRPNRTVEAAANLFRASWEAVDKTFELAVVRPVAERSRVRVGQAVMSFAAADEALAAYFFNRNAVSRCHDFARSEPGPRDRSYHFAALLYADARVLAAACAQQVKYHSAAGFRRKNGDICHPNMAFVNYLIRNARSRALRAMAACARQGIPCPVPQLVFCRAETLHGMSGIDPVDAVLRRYWESALGAKALLMAFGDVENAKEEAK